jgi:hypothetical protein
VVGLEKRKTSTVPENEPRFLVCTARILNYPWPQQFCTTTITSLTLSQIKVPYDSLWKLQRGRKGYTSARGQVKREMSTYANSWNKINRRIGVTQNHFRNSMLKLTALRFRSKSHKPADRCQPQIRNEEMLACRINDNGRTTRRNLQCRAQLKLREKLIQKLAEAEQYSCMQEEGEAEG